MNKLKKMKLARHLARMGKILNSYKFLVQERERMISFTSSRSRWKDDIKKYLKEGD
jgi:hypothetical protein